MDEDIKLKKEYSGLYIAKKTFDGVEYQVVAEKQMGSSDFRYEFTRSSDFRFDSDWGVLLKTIKRFDWSMVVDALTGKSSSSPYHLDYDEE